VRVVFQLSLGIRCLKMEANKFLTILIVVFSVYFIGDYVFYVSMYFLVSASVIGTLIELLEVIGLGGYGESLELVIVLLIWMAVFISSLVLACNIQYSILKWVVVILIGLLIYVLDNFVQLIVIDMYLDNVITEKIEMCLNSDISILAMIFLRSIVLSFIVYKVTQVSVVKSN